MSDIGYFNFNDPDLIAKRKQKIIEFFKLKNESEINENIILKLNENLKEINEFLVQNSILEELMGRTFKLFTINMNKIILNLFKIQKDMKMKLKNIISDINKKFEGMQVQLNELINKYEEQKKTIEEQKKTIEEQKKTIEELQSKNEQDKLQIEILKNNFAHLKTKFDSLNSKFNNLKDLCIQFIQNNEDTEKLLGKKADLKMKIFELIDN